MPWRPPPPGALAVVPATGLVAATEQGRAALGDDLLLVVSHHLQRAAIGRRHIDDARQPTLESLGRRRRETVIVPRVLAGHRLQLRGGQLELFEGPLCIVDDEAAVVATEQRVVAGVGDVLCRRGGGLGNGLIGHQHRGQSDGQDQARSTAHLLTLPGGRDRHRASAEEPTAKIRRNRRASSQRRRRRRKYRGGLQPARRRRPVADARARRINSVCRRAPVL